MDSEEEAEFCEYVSSQAERLRKFAYLCCGDWHRAEDAVQKSLLKLYRAWSRANRETLDAYTRRIIVNTVTDEQRRSWFRRERTVDRAPEPISQDPSASSAERLTLLAALADLPPRQRVAVVLRHWEDLPIEHTAQIMTGAVKSQTA